MAINDSNTAGDEHFWLNMAAESIYNASEKREASVKSLVTLILWTFGLFTAGTTGFLSFFGGIRDFDRWSLFAFGVAFFFLCLAYFFANRALYPVAKSFRPDEVDAIKKGYSEIVEKQTKRFLWGSFLTALGFFAIAVGIFLQFWSVSKNKTITKQSPYYLNAKVERRGNNIFIPVTVLSKDRQAVELYFFNCGSIDSIVGNTSMLLFSRVFTTDTTGLLQFSYPLETDTVKSVIVKAVFRDRITPDSLEERAKAIKLFLKK